MSEQSRPYFVREYLRALRRTYDPRVSWWNQVRAGGDAYVLGAALRGYPVSVLPSNVYKKGKI